MTDTGPLPATVWPLAPGEHPELPRLRVEVHEGRPAIAGRRGTTSIPPYVRVLFSPLPTVSTGDPDRLRHYAAQLHAAATVLEREHAMFVEYTGQLPLTGQA